MDTELKAGRELDALIAEKVMGWKFAGEFTPDDSNGFERYYQDVPNYSTDISAAWEVVEKITIVDLVGYGIRIDRFTEESGRKYMVIIIETSTPPECEEMTRIDPVYADTAPHAICLAALKAMKLL